MQPYYREGDTLMLMPSEQIHNDCLAVIHFMNDGVIFRKVETIKGKIRLATFNKNYEAENYQAEDISWAYPVHERGTRLFSL
jgi:phage repressor protein C with HTH and peptisase S24 domain